MTLWDKKPLGRSGVSTSRLGIASSYGIGGDDIVRAFDRGINFFYFGSRRRQGFAEGFTRLPPAKRDQAVVVVQSYSRLGFLMKGSLESALRSLGTEYADFLLLGLWNGPPPSRIMDSALELVEQGKVRHIMISCHHRPTFTKHAADPRVGSIMVRYNAAHPGAEREVFPFLDAARPGVVAYTATRWGWLMNPDFTPEGEATPRASDCYRFALSHPAVDVVLTGPKNAVELDEAMAALDRGPMSEDELAWMKRVGSHVRKAAIARGRNPARRLWDRAFPPRALSAA
jgi:aryl-alcohol dehydrogenase-like predicted oxidoreductase